jgi:hypothetical protein
MFHALYTSRIRVPTVRGSEQILHESGHAPAFTSGIDGLASALTYSDRWHPTC